MKKIIVGLVLLFGASASVYAKEPIYIGGGLGINSLDPFDDATGFQIFGGYELGDMGVQGVKFSVEAGYMDTGDFELEVTLPIIGTITQEASASGIWATGVAAYAASPEIDILGRLGLDFGDDDGLMLGFGVGYNFNKQMQLRGEYVIRDNIDSLQVNFVYHL